MPLRSDLELNSDRFDPKNITETTHKFNNKLIDIMAGGPKWYEVGAERYRHMRWNGETPLPKPEVLPYGQTINIPSRDPHRTIPCRLFTPQDPSTKPKALFYHIHGGGWVLQSHDSQDLYLSWLSNTLSLTVLSVGYRLAPENPYPAPNDDCFDVAKYLISHSAEKFGVEMAFIGGESAGGHLALTTALRICREGKGWEGLLKGGLVLNFGAFNLANWAPQAVGFETGRGDGVPLVLDLDLMMHYRDAYLPGLSEEQRMNPDISPLYSKDLRELKLPPALFTCGTSDCLLDDSVFMCAKYKMAGGDATLRIFPGGAHGYMMFSPKTPGVTETAQQGLGAIEEFVKSRI